MSDDDDFDKMMAEIEAPAEKPAAAPARRGKKTQTVVTDDQVNPEPALAKKIADEKAAEPEEPAMVKIAGLANQQAEPVKVTIVEDAPQTRAYMSPQTLAEIEAGKAILNRFK